MAVARGGGGGAGGVRGDRNNLADTMPSNKKWTDVEFLNKVSLFYGKL